MWKFDKFESKAIILLCSLPDSWDPVVTTVSTSKSSKHKLVYDEIVATLLSEDMQRSNKESSSGEALTAVSIKNRGRNNHHRRSKSASHSKSKERKGGDCWFCRKSGHVKKDCRGYKRAQERVRESQANNVYDKDDSVLILSTTETTQASWVLDSGTSFHATSCTEYFSNYQEGKFGQVYLGDNKACEIVGKRDILLSLKGGVKWLLKDVCHVPKLKRNLISVSQLCAQGFVTSLTDSWKVTKGSMLVAKGDKIRSLYIVENIGEVGAAMTIEDSNSELWHQRLGHMSKKGLAVMHKREQLPGLKSVDLQFCEHCLYGK